MKRSIHIIFLCTALLFSSCNKRTIFDGADVLAEDFEQVTDAEMLYGENGNWTFYQQTHSNTMVLDTTNAHSGSQCLKFTAAPTDENGASKSDLAHNDLAFWEGDRIAATAWYYIEGSVALPYLFLWDLEEDVSVGAGPGIRLAIDQETGALFAERNKMMEASIYQENETALPFPRNQWVKIEVEMELKQNKKGYLKVWQDDQLIIDAQNIRTLPKDKSVLIQGTKGMYNSLQVGITANSSAAETVLYIDDVSIHKIK